MTPIAVDIEAVRRLIETAAAEEIAPRFGNLRDGDVRAKGPGDFVTVADLATEAFLTAELAALLPGSLVVGEEAVAEDRSIQDRLLSPDRPVWIIDPVDGTGNFVASRPAVAVIVALAWQGETIAGWICDPLKGETATVERGSGAWFRGARMTVSQPDDSGQLTGSINLKRVPAALRQQNEAKRSRLRRTAPLMCAGQEYLRLGQGAIDFLAFWNLKPWDHAAGVLLHGEAGGYSARLNSDPYRPTDREGGVLLAPNRPLWDTLHGILLG